MMDILPYKDFLFECFNRNLFVFRIGSARRVCDVDCYELGALELQMLNIVCVDMVPAYDDEPISMTRIRREWIDDGAKVLVRYVCDLFLLEVLNLIDLNEENGLRI